MNTETLRCCNCNEPFSRALKRGRKPRFCPVCVENNGKVMAGGRTKMTAKLSAPQREKKEIMDKIKKHFKTSIYFFSWETDYKYKTLQDVLNSPRATKKLEGYIYNEASKKYIKNVTSFNNAPNFFKEEIDNHLKNADGWRVLLPDSPINKEHYSSYNTPPDVVKEILDQLPEEVWKDRDQKWLDISCDNGEFVVQAMKRFEQNGISNKYFIENKLVYVENDRTQVVRTKLRLDPKKEFCHNAYVGDPLQGRLTNLDSGEEVKIKDMKFDIIVGNPPFQKPQNAPGPVGGRREALWPSFIELSYSLLKKNGHLAFIHPSGWRKPPSPRARFNIANEILCEKMTLRWLKLHDSKAAKKLWGVGSRFDYYVAQKKPYNGETFDFVGDDSEKKQKIKIPKERFIPNNNIQEVFSYLPKNDEKTCKVLYSRNAYGSDKSHVNDEQNNEFVYPLVHSTPKSEVRWAWSSRNDKGFFGIPKVIFGDGTQETPVLDVNGDYGMTQHAIAIQIKDKEDGEKLIAFLKSDKMKVLKKATSWSNFQLDRRFFELLKEGFWR